MAKRELDLVQFGAAWTKTAIDSWAFAAGVTVRPVFRGMNNGDVVIGERLSTQGILRAITRYADAIMPHDLRRASARFAFKGMGTVR